MSWEDRGAFERETTQTNPRRAQKRLSVQVPELSRESRTADQRGSREDQHQKLTKRRRPRTLPGRTRTASACESSSESRSQGTHSGITAARDAISGRERLCKDDNIRTFEWDKGCPQTVRATVVNGRPKREGNGTRGNATKGWHSDRRDNPHDPGVSTASYRYRSIPFLSLRSLTVARPISVRRAFLNLSRGAGALGSEVVRVRPGRVRVRLRFFSSRRLVVLHTNPKEPQLAMVQAVVSFFS
jgi:hypothetical protein